MWTELNLMHMFSGWENSSWVKKIANTLKIRSSHVTILILTDNELKCTDIQYITQALQANTTLKKLHLNKNLIRDIGAEAVAALIEGNTSLTEVHLAKNHITSKGAKFLAVALETNRTLRVLSLGSNEIGNDGAKYFEECLKAVTLKEFSLNTLDLELNPITDVAALHKLRNLVSEDYRNLTKLEHERNAEISSMNFKSLMQRSMQSRLLSYFTQPPILEVLWSIHRK